jgi:16S rRNA (uracil1498-N3)-methyltransferase
VLPVDLALPIIYWHLIVLRQSIIYRACEQCGRNVPPTLKLAVSLAEWQQTCVAGDKLIFEPEVKQTLQTYPKPSGAIAVLVGPEGGFSEQEVVAAKQASFTALGFGPRVLRNETAAMATVAALQVLWGDLA